MEPLRSVRPLMVLVLLYPGADSSDVVTVRRGDPAVLQCEVDPGDTLRSVTWRLHLCNSSCVISYKIEEEGNKTSYSSCSPRMRSDHLSLTINNTEISDEGTYACQVVNDFAKITQYLLLQVLVQPSTYLKLSSDGSPECGAIGGNPPAQISWIPNADDINITKLENPDWTWSVISTISIRRVSRTSVTCAVSHPTFVIPQKSDITLSGNNLRIDNIFIVIVTVVFTVLTAGILLYLKIKCQGLKIPEHESNED
ncbi:cell surface glycoprotein CD200 receptor 1-like [Dendrobates tinctorius]|uniref:cell surface glycoprotein CD200 receptor 1-like n=1 Tax=Dendrobates tinctorius TaxID=92724 RepID=UPI003CC94359